MGLMMYLWCSVFWLISIWKFILLWLLSVILVSILWLMRWMCSCMMSCFWV